MKNHLVTRARLAFCWGFFALVFLAGQIRYSSAQMIRTSLPFTTVKDSFYERIGIDFGFSLRGSRAHHLGDHARGVFGLGPGGQLRPNITFSQGSIHSAVPPFGGYDPGTDATFGYRVQNGTGGYHLGFRFGKGSTRSITNTTPVIMTRNGVPGSLFHGTVHPFVTGIVPVVGNGGYAVPGLGEVQYTSPLELKLRQLHMDRQSGIRSHLDTSAPAQPGSTSASSTSASSTGASSTGASRNRSTSNSTALRGDLSVKEINRLKRFEDQRKEQEMESRVKQFLLKSEKALANGRDGAARSYLRTAIQYSNGNQKIELQKKLQDLIDKN